MIVPEEQMNFKLSTIPGNSIYFNYRTTIYFEKGFSIFFNPWTPFTLKIT